MRRLLTFLLLLLCLGSKAQFQGLIVNEFSQGTTGHPPPSTNSKEFIELIVVGNKTCTDSTVDIRGWIFDDHNGWYGPGPMSGIAGGHMRFSMDLNWSSVRYGSLILIYNSIDKNTNITLSDDPTDFNNDGVYVVAATSTYIDDNGTVPSAGTTNPAVSYAGATYASGGNWNRVGLANTGDALIIVNPNFPTTAHFSIAYGALLGGSQTPTITKGAVPAGSNCYLSDANYVSASSYLIGVAGTPQETPGAPNGGANTTWIQFMREPLPPLPPTNITICREQGQSYVFNNQNLTTTGHYADTLTSVAGCDSIVNLYLLFSTTQQVTLSGCEGFVFNNVTYTSSTIVRDTIKSVISNCDSLITVTNINIMPSSHGYINQCVATGQSYFFNNQNLTTTGHYLDTIVSNASCDSIIHLYLVVAQTQTKDTVACNQLVLNNVTYTSSTSIRDTINSVINGCDSIIHITNITINPTKHSSINQCLSAGQSYFFNNQSLTNTGHYLDTLSTSSGCDSILHLYLVVNQVQATTLNGCGSLEFNNTTYTSSTIIRDTIRSIINGCDSIVRSVSINVFPNPPPTQLNVCLPPGGSYTFNGNVLTSTGHYTAQYSSINGCDSIVNLYLLVTRSETINLQGCSTVVYNGNTYTSSTSLNETIPSIVFGCDSLIRTINIQISNSVSSQLSACLQQGQTYNFNGSPLTVSGHYTDTLTSVQGCDSIIHLDLVFSRVETLQLSGCDSLTYNGITYTSSTVLTDTVYSLSGCDSIYQQVNISLNQTIHTYTSACIPLGQTFTFNGQNLTATGNYSSLHVRPGQCDSIVHLYLLVSSSHMQTFTACGSFTFNGNLYTTTTQLQDTIRSLINNCDSIIRVTNIIIEPLPVTNTTACMSQGQSYNLNGQILTATGNYTTTYVRPGQCDSIVNLYLLVSQTINQNFQGCGSYTYNNVTYTTATVLRDTISSMITNCDSIYNVINIDIVSVLTTNINACLQQGQNYNLNGQILTTTGYYTTTYVRPGLCDSVVNLYLVVSNSQTQTFSGCGSYIYNGTTYTNSTTIRDTVQSILNGCDSIYYLTHINIQPIPQTYTTACLASGQTYNFNGQNLNATGHYTTTYVRPGLCDSIVHLYLVVSNTNTQTLSGCGSVVYNGNSYTTSTQIRDTIHSLVTNCDSIINVVNINIGGFIQTTITACLAQGQTYNFNGQTLTTTGNYTTTFTQPGRCDSVVSLYLVVSSSQTQNINGCGSLLFNGVMYTTSTTLRDTIRSVITSCDSLIRTVNIHINPIVTRNIFACIVPGQQYIFNGQSLINSGHYTATLTSSFGCDSIVNLYLVVARFENVQISGCELVRYNGIDYTSSVTINEVIPSLISSCDSVVRTVNIVVNQKPDLVVGPSLSICRGSQATLTATAPGSTIEWLGEGFGNTITVTPAVSRLYTAVATNSAGCKDTASVMVLLRSFDVDLSIDANPAIAGTNVKLKTTSTSDFTILSWSPVSLFTNHTAKTQNIIADSSMLITVIGRSSDGCLDTTSLSLIVEPLDGIYIPSAFTPNHDGRNDLFTIAGGSIQKMQMRIYNRWGQQIFYSSERSRGWDGTVAGKEQTTGAYVYYLNVTLKDGRVINRRGTILLIR